MSRLSPSLGATMMMMMMMMMFIHQNPTPASLASSLEQEGELITVFFTELITVFFQAGRFELYRQHWPVFASFPQGCKFRFCVVIK